MASEQIKVAVIGIGRLGRHLVYRFHQYSFIQLFLFNRTKGSIAEFTGFKNITILESIARLPNNLDLCLLTVSDHAIHIVAEDIPGKIKKECIIAHCSGASSLDILPGSVFKKAVMWPIQSFSHDIILNWNELPVILDNNTNIDQEKISKLANLISPKVLRLNERDRQILHVAAVFSSNFTIFLIELAAHLCREIGVELNILMPLIKNSIKKLELIRPDEAMTGPASRGDIKTIENQKEILEAFPGLQEIYQLLSQQIMNRHRG